VALLTTTVGPFSAEEMKSFDVSVFYRKQYIRSKEFELIASLFGSVEYVRKRMGALLDIQISLAYYSLTRRELRVLKTYHAMSIFPHSFTKKTKKEVEEEAKLIYKKLE
jgi:hypothetical protein